MTQFVIMKRRGAHVEPLSEASIFDDLVEAEIWAATYLEGDPALFDQSLDSIEVHRQEPQLATRQVASGKR
ncbi:hypothetical protein FZC33_10590 [Labrys sp. KNU-23]|uniref:hypothetical protein n=1 Tax=Labrys sp. KNU-23 TaxID=2789216 RepID=UPI0011EF17E1|nr:hypothetical protein [Labrys sp. KNU-23]QEN86748.1 hypothetical protein FZC33_10590 [Labrys sp. KNU-23]